MPCAGWKGHRTTSASAFLQDGKCPPNLEVVTDTRVTKVLFEDKSATGVVTDTGKECEFCVSELADLSIGTHVPDTLMQTMLERKSFCARERSTHQDFCSYPVWDRQQTSRS